MTSPSRKQSGRRRHSADKVGTRRYVVPFALRHQKWAQAVARLEAAIARLKTEPQPMGAKWAANQITYFEQRLTELRGYEPKPK